MILPTLPPKGWDCRWGGTVQSWPTSVCQGKVYYFPPGKPKEEAGR